MTMHVKVGGSWRTVSPPAVKVSGSWRSLIEGYVRVGGTWRQFFATQHATTVTVGNFGQNTGFPYYFTEDWYGYDTNVTSGHAFGSIGSATYAGKTILSALHFSTLFGGSGVVFVLSGTVANDDAAFVSVKMNATTYARSSASYSVVGGNSRWYWAGSNPWGLSGTKDLVVNP